MSAEKKVTETPGAASAAPGPGPAAPSSEEAAPESAPGDIPEGTAKSQIRRVVLLYSPGLDAEKDSFSSFLAEVALGVGKKPVYLRKVIIRELAADADMKALAEEAVREQAVAVLAVLKGLPGPKLQELEEALSAANISLRAAEPEEVQKRSLAVDIIVDIMMSPSES